MNVFAKDKDYAAFESLLEETLESQPMRICAYCLMPNHWHFVLWPRQDGELSEFMRWLTVTHTQRWHAHRHTSGTGPIHQGRFKSFPIEADEHLWTVLRYVERSALRAGLVPRAEAWPWGSAARFADAARRALLSAWPMPRPADWLALVNGVETEAELEAVRRSVRRGCPYGDAAWVQRTAKRLGLESTLRLQGRPKKAISG